MKFQIKFFSALIINFIYASNSFGDEVNVNRLNCVDLLTPLSQKGSSTSFKFSENLKNMNLKDYSMALVGVDKRKNLMLLPSVRNGMRGFYLYTDNGPFWYQLPKIIKKGEFKPNFLKIENNEISKTPLYLTYYDGVESSGAEYSNKSVGMTTFSKDLTNLQEFHPASVVGILDGDSNLAFLENYKNLLSTIYPVYLRNIENTSPKKKQEVKDKFKKSLAACEELFKQTHDLDFLNLTKNALTEFEEHIKHVPDEEGSASAKK